MKFKAIYYLFVVILFNTSAQATSVSNGIAFGDAYGNTQYEIVDKTVACNYQEKESGGSVVRVLAAADSFTFNFPSQGA